MIDDKIHRFNTIFVDCFNTIIFRNKKRKDVFIDWAKKLAEIYHIDWSTIYKTYTRTNFNMSFKKLFTTFTLQEDFESVLKNVYLSLYKKNKSLDQNEFIDTAKNVYIQSELESFVLNQDIIAHLARAKEKGKSVYLVSDFYCKSDILTQWLTSLGVANIFTGIYSSSDFAKEKATTKLYRKLLSLLSLDRKKVRMYGDNIWSDILMARLCGIKSKRIKSNTKEKL